MSINIYNAEGYYDPTAYAALSNIAKEDKAIKAFRSLVYICSAYSGDLAANKKAARRYCRFAVGKGYIPIAPHLLFPQFLDDTVPKERQLGLHFGNVLMRKCSEVWVFGEHISAGMEAEIAKARQRNYCLRYFTEKCEEVENYA